MSDTLTFTPQNRRGVRKQSTLACSAVLAAVELTEMDKSKFLFLMMVPGLVLP